MNSNLDGVTVVDHPLVRLRLTALRDAESSHSEFRRALRELASLMVFEVTRGIEVETCDVLTPLGTSPGVRLSRPVAVFPILRAGLAMAEAMLESLPEASVGHIGMYRDEETLRPQSYYYREPPDLSSRLVLLVDPMLATGHSASEAVTQLKARGAERIVFVCLVCAPEGLKHLRGNHPDVPIFTAAIDRGLNERGYIVPGLGDAGDRYFGTE